MAAKGNITGENAVQITQNVLEMLEREKGIVFYAAVYFTTQFKEKHREDL